MIRVQLDEAQRQGTFVTTSFVVPANATSPLVIRPRMRTVDMQNPNVSIMMRLYKLNQESGQWERISQDGWRGHPAYDPNDPDQQPAPETPVEAHRGATVRAEIEVPARIPCGVEVHSD